MEERTIQFTRTSPATFTCPAGSHPGQVYVLNVHGDPRPEDGARIFCTCQGAMRRGPDTCKHARQLRLQGLHEQVATHVVTVRDDVPGCNFEVSCTCGYRVHMATLSREHADQRAEEHLNPAPPPDLFAR